MTVTTTRAPAPDEQRATPPAIDPSRRVDLRRLSSPVAAAALAASAVGAVGMTLGTVVAGRLAEHPSRGLVWLLAICLVGAAVIDTAGKIAWVGRSDRAEGRLREDLLRAALRQPLSALNEQAVGEVLDRVDDDTHEVGNLVRWQIWMMSRTLFGAVPMWVVAGVTWWPSFVLFPVLGTLTWLAIRSLLGEISRRKVIEEMAWTDHAAALEEGIAGRDDLRTSLGQPHVVRRIARLSADVHTKFKAVVEIESRLVRRAGVLLHALLAGIAVAGVVLAAGDHLSVAQLVTLFLVTSTFVGQIAMVTYHLPDLQAGLGAVIRLRQMLAVPPEPDGGSALPDGPLDLELRHLDFAYAEGTFALQGIDLRVPAGQTVALVGRTGSGKSTLAALISRAMEPPRGTVFLGGTDVRELDLQHLRRSRRRGHPAHRDPRRHAGREHHALRRAPPQPGRRGRRGARSGRLGRRAAGRPRHPARPGRHLALRRRGAAGRLRPAAGPRRPRGRARRGHRADGPAHREPRRGRRRPAARRAAPASSSPTGCPRSSGRHWSPSSTAGASSSRAPAPSSPSRPDRSATC